MRRPEPMMMDRPYHEDNMDTAARVLSLAQQTADQAIADARREADETLGRARREADEVLTKARRQAEQITGDATVALGRPGQVELELGRASLDVDDVLLCRRLGRLGSRGDRPYETKAKDEVAHTQNRSMNHEVDSASEPQRLLHHIHQRLARANRPTFSTSVARCRSAITGE